MTNPRPPGSLFRQQELNPADLVTEGPAQWLSPSLLAPKGLSVSGGTGHYSFSSPRTGKEMGITPLDSHELTGFMG